MSEKLSSPWSSLNREPERSHTSSATVVNTATSRVRVHLTRYGVHVLCDFVDDNTPDLSAEEVIEIVLSYAVEDDVYEMSFEMFIQVFGPCYCLGDEEVSVNNEITFLSTD